MGETCGGTSEPDATGETTEGVDETCGGTGEPDAGGETGLDSAIAGTTGAREERGLGISSTKTSDTLGVVVRWESLSGESTGEERLGS